MNVITVLHTTTYDVQVSNMIKDEINLSILLNLSYNTWIRVMCTFERQKKTLYIVNFISGLNLIKISIKTWFMRMDNDFIIQYIKYVGAFINYYL